MEPKYRKNRSIVLATLLIAGIFVGSPVFASGDQSIGILEVKVFGYVVKVWATGVSYTVELVKAPIVKSAPISR